MHSSPSFDERRGVFFRLIQGSEKKNRKNEGAIYDAFSREKDYPTCQQ